MRRIRRVVLWATLIVSVLLGTGSFVYAAPQQQTPAGTSAPSPAQTGTSQTPTTGTATGSTGTAPQNGTGQTNSTTPATPVKSEQLWGTSGWTVPFIEAVNNARITYGKQAFDLIAASLTPLISAILGIWILLQAARLLMPFGPMESGSRIMTSVFIRIMLGIAVMMMMRNYQIFWTAQNAIIEGGLEGSAAIIERALRIYNPQQGSGAPNTAGIPAGGCSRPNAAITPAAAAANAGQDQALLKTLEGEAERGARLSCSLSLMQASMGVGMNVGISLLLDVVKKPFWAILQGVGGIPVILASGIVTGGESTWVLMRMLAGAVLMGIFGLASFLMAFRFIDVIVKWTVVTILAPVFISLFLFRNTRQIAWGGLKMMLADALTLIFMAVILAVMVSFFNYVLSPGSASYGSYKTMEELSQAQLHKGLAEPAFWHLLVIGLMTLGLMSQAGAWAGHAVSMPGMLQLPAVGAKVADTLQSAAGRLVSELGGMTFNRRWRAQKKDLNPELRRAVAQPRT
jgi:hypothetical protein